MLKKTVLTRLTIAFVALYLLCTCVNLRSSYGEGVGKELNMFEVGQEEDEISAYDENCNDVDMALAKDIEDKISSIEKLPLVSEDKMAVLRSAYLAFRYEAQGRTRCLDTVEYCWQHFSEDPLFMIDYAKSRALREGKSVGPPQYCTAFVSGDDVRIILARDFAIEDMDLQVHQAYDSQKDGFFIEGETGYFFVNHSFIEAREDEVGDVYIIGEGDETVDIPESKDFVYRNGRICSIGESKMYLLLKKYDDGFYFSEVIIKPTKFRKEL